MKGNRIGAWRRGVLLLMAVLLAAGLAACSSSSKDSLSKSERSVVADQAAAPAEMDSLTVSNEAAAAPSAAVQTTAASQAESGGTSSYTGGGIGPIADANAGYDRKVIYRADLVMKVKEFRVAEEQLMNQIHLSGAYVLQFSDSRNANEVGANFVIKVPSSGFSSFLEKLQQIENLKFERQVQGSDVTEEFVDLEARLKTQQTLEARYLEFMDKATKTDDLVKFANQLAQVQETIEQIKGRMRYLDQNVAFSTVNLRLYQSDTDELRKEEKQEKNFGDRISDALSGSANVLRQFGEGLLVVLAAMLPVLIVVAVLGVPTYYFVRKRGKARRKTSEEKRKAWNQERLESGESMESDEEGATENAITDDEAKDASSQDENR